MEQDQNRKVWGGTLVGGTSVSFEDLSRAFVIVAKEAETLPQVNLIDFIGHRNAQPLIDSDGLWHDTTSLIFLGAEAVQDGEVWVLSYKFVRVADLHPTSDIPM